MLLVLNRESVALEVPYHDLIEATWPVQALPIFLDRLADPITAVLISITVVLVFGGAFNTQALLTVE